MAKWKSGARGGRPDRGGGGFRGGRGRGNNNRGHAGWKVQGPGRGRGHNHSGSNQDELEVDFTLQTYANAPLPLQQEPSASARGRGMPAFRGRGRGGSVIPSRLSVETAFPGKGRGFDIPRRHVQGIGASKDARRPIPVGAKQTLSSLLLQERPLLKPIMFVPSTETRFLFQNEEELLQPIVGDLGDTLQSPIPTADRVTRVFSGGNIPPDVWDKDEDGTEGEIEVVDFNDFGKLFLPITMSSKTAIQKGKNKVVPVENSGVHEGLPTRNTNQETHHLPEPHTKITDKPLSTQNGVEINGNHIFHLDTQPGNVPNGMGFTANRQPSSSFLPGDGDDEDVIVYEAPHPRTTFTMSSLDAECTGGDREKLTPHEHPPVGSFSSYQRHGALPASVPHTQPNSISIVEESISSLSPATVATTSAKLMLSDTAETTNAATETGDTMSTARLRVPPITTPRQAKLWKSKLSRANRTGINKSLRTPFRAFGSMREEDLLQKIDGERDQRYNERRRGDSDIEWGETTDDGVGDIIGVGKKVVAQMPEPELDADMKRVLGMLEKGNGLEQAKDDIDDDHGMEVDVDFDIATSKQFVRRLTGPDAGRHVTMDDIECKEIMRMEDEGDVEQMGSSSSEVEESADEEEEALRIEEAKFIQDGDLSNLDKDDLGGSADIDEDDDGEDDDDLDDDDDYEDNSFRFKLDRLRSMSNNAKGNLDDGDDPLERNMSWADLDEAFIKDINAILDEEENLLTTKQKLSISLSGDHEDLSRWKGIPPELSIQYEIDRQKKAERKKARELERLTGAGYPLSNKKDGKKGRKTLLAAASTNPTIVVIPNRVIDMTTLVQNIRRFIADLGGPSSMSLPPTDKETRKNTHEIAAAFNLRSVSKGKGESRFITLIKTTKTSIQANEGKISRILRRGGAKGILKVPRHREGDVVGMAAPKLDESNVGFRLLEMMGWSEGNRIGASTNGLEAPLAAIIKTTKLGLGAKK